jgi:hypothetical protein
MSAQPPLGPERNGQLQGHTYDRRWIDADDAKGRNAGGARPECLSQTVSRPILDPEEACLTRCRNGSGPGGRTQLGQDG